MTAAHCVDGDISGVLVNLGSIYLGEWEVQFDVPSSSIIKHPDWNPEILRNDLALIPIPEVSFSDSIQAALIPARGDTNDFAGQQAYIVGWGGTGNDSPLPEVLQYADVPILNNEECSNQLGGLDVENTLVCSEKVSGKGVCLGDSGGPLVLQDQPMVVGVTAILYDGCESGYPNLFTRVTTFREWIFENSGV